MKSRFVLRDEAAREEQASKAIVVTPRPTVSLHEVESYLAGGAHFQVSKPLEGEKQNFFKHFCAGRKCNFDIGDFVKTVQKYRIISLDTEGKNGRIFLILGNFLGDVLLFNDARNIPQELRDILSDINIFKIQSNVEEDVKILAEECKIRVVGMADSQVVHGCFNLGSDDGNVGTVAQARFCGVDPRPYHHHMDFQIRNKLPEPKSLLHALSDGRQPFLTVFKAVVRHVKLLPFPFDPEKNVFDFIWNVLCKVAGTSTRAVLSIARPRRRTSEENWAVSTVPCSNSYVTTEDLNNATEIAAIYESQKGWPPTKSRPTNQAKKFWTSDNYRQAKNRKRSLDFKEKRYNNPEKYCKKPKWF